MTVAVILLGVVVVLLAMLLTNLADKVSDIKYVLDRHERRLDYQWNEICETQHTIIELQKSLSKSEEKRKKMGDAFFLSLNVLKERHEQLLNLVVKLKTIDNLTGHSQDKAIESLEKSIETTDEMLLELSTKVEYLENR